MWNTIRFERLSFLKHQFQLSFLRLITLFALATLLASLLAYLATFHWALELFTHFRFQYFCASLVFVVLFGIIKSYKSMSLMLVCALLNLIEISPWYLNQNKTILLDNSQPLKLMLSNVNSRNTHYSRLIDQVLIQNPDIFITQEVNELWIKQLKSLNNQYPHQVIKPREDNFGIAVYSRIPLSNYEILYLGKANLPSIRVDFLLANKPVTLLTTHPLPPMGGRYSGLRNEQLIELAQLSEAIDTPLIVIGDLNITMWSPDYVSVTASGKLKNTRQGFGLSATWPARLGVFGIPIDHCLVSKDFYVEDMQTGENIGSDHLPIVVSLKLLTDEI